MVPITHEIALRSRDLPGFACQDPGDRFLAATCLVHELTLITRDQSLLEYRALSTLW
jgi:PIN domain nuclease of toxin-antitoxin system